MTQLLPTPNELQNKLPLTNDLKNFITSSRALFKNILLKKEKRFVIFCGPCSIHNEEVAIDFAKRLKELQKEISFTLIMRFFYEKPRTKTGWKGFLYDPDLDGSNNLIKGLEKTRDLLIKIGKLQIPVCSELLDPIFTLYFSDLISWGFIGARTVSSQIHRQMASSLPFPIGFKNSVDGNIDTAIHAVISAKEKHSFASLNLNGKLQTIHSQGNNFTHIVLRGAETFTNNDEKTILSTLKKMENNNFPQIPIAIDCSHGNSPNYPDQEKSFLDSLNFAKKDLIFGLMLESCLFAGFQEISSNLKYGVSITDGCLDFNKTKDLLLFANRFLDPTF